MKIGKFGLLFFIVVFLFTPLFGFTLRAAGALSADEAYLGIVKINLFTLSNDKFLTGISSGSGAIIDANGLVLTNYHVVTVEEDYDQSKREVAYQICLTKDKNEEPECKYTARLVASDKDNDVALLKIRNISGLSSDQSYPYLNLSGVSADTNDDITVLGYPGIGGDTITLTQGVVSGKLSKYNLDWFKTDADISFGNSGGAGINSAGRIIGITTMSHVDMLGSMGYLVNITSVRSWIEANKNSSEKISLLESRLIEFTRKEQAIKTSDVFSEDYPAFKITKPSDWEFIYPREDIISVTDEDDYEGGGVTFYIMSYPFLVNFNDIDFIFKMDNLLFLSMLNLVKSETITIGTRLGKKITFSVFGEIGKAIYVPHGEFVFKINYDYGENEKDKETIDGIIDSLDLNDFTTQLKTITNYSNSRHGFSLNLTSSGWVGAEYESIESPIVLNYDSNRAAMAIIRIKKRTDDTAGLSNNELYNISVKEMEDMNDILSAMGSGIDILSARSYANIGTNINNAIMFENTLKKGEAIILRSLMYSVYFADRIIEIEFSYFGEDQAYEGAKASFNQLMGTLTIDDYQAANIVEEVLVYGKESEDRPNETEETQVEESVEVPGGEEALEIKNQSLYSRLKGKIMLKVEDQGKAYYIHPQTQAMYYLGRPDDAFAVMREQGIGITNSDLYKIPIGTTKDSGQDSDGDGLTDYLEETLGLDKSKNDTDGDGYPDGDELKNGYSPWGAGVQNLDNGFANKQAGRILLQVEKAGEAWYINPSDSKRYFLGRPADAFAAMRNLGLGISNNDFVSLSE